MSVVYLLLLPVIAHAQLTVDIQVSGSSKVTARATGQSETIINADHKELFHITDQLLKNAVFKLTEQYGEVFLEEPSGSNDVYGNYKLEPVKTLLRPNGTKVKITREDVVLNKLQTFNHDVIATSQYITLAGNIEDKMKCFWKQNAVFPAEISYNVDVIGLGKAPKWNLKSTFGKDLLQIQAVPLSNASFAANLGPKTDATAILSASKVTIVIDINYVATLTGHVLTKFDDNYVWGYENHDIKTLMSAVAMPDSVVLSEEITIEFYSDCEIRMLGENVNVTRNVVTQCLFTIEDGKNASNVNWSRAQYKSQGESTANEDIEMPKKLQGNGTTRTSGLSLLFITYVFMIVQRLNNYCIFLFSHLS